MQIWQRHKSFYKAVLEGRKCWLLVHLKHNTWDILTTKCFKDIAHDLLSINIQDFTWAHCWKSFYSNSAWERIQEKSGSSLCIKFSHPLTPPLFVLYLLLPSNTKAASVWLSHFSPSSLLVILSVSETKASVTFPGFMSLSLCLSLPLHTFHLTVLQPLTVQACANAVIGCPAVGQPPTASVTSVWSTQSNKLCYRLH